MTDTPGQIGGRIAARRHARRMTQADLSRASFVSLSMIRGIERGVRSPSDKTLDSLAAALDVDPSRLVNGNSRTSGRVHSALPHISAAIAGYDVPDGPALRSLPELTSAVNDALTWRLGAQYSRLAVQAPALLGDALRTLHTATGHRRKEAAQLLASAARAADAVAYKFGAYDLSARLVELLRWACTRAGDPLLNATTAYVRTETFLAARSYATGLRALEAAIDAAPSPKEPRSVAARGALHMRAAVVAGRAGDETAADTHLAEAEPLAALLPEGIYNGTAFGPSSLRIHQVSVAVSLGTAHVSRALDVARDWKPPRDLPSERRSSFSIELARAQVWAGLMDDAFESLKAARRVAPQHTREHPWAREDTATLRRLKRADAEELTAFAAWIGAV
ncbi:helix-turn-helix domain-containing protein [Streptomyces sp. NPDC059569]|uniref:helix-turn-helix domain-containing protein n=1 Tax=Streptomyces sp. NPDC059569 TaxID=3346869 RepID=UPI0036AE4A77